MSIVKIRERDYRRAQDRVQDKQNALDAAQAALDEAEAEAEIMGRLLDEAKADEREDAEMRAKLEAICANR